MKLRSAICNLAGSIDQGRTMACMRLFFAYVVFGCAPIVLSQEAPVVAPVRVANGCINLVMDKDVQKSLKLDESQVAALDQRYLDVRETSGEFLRLIRGKETSALSEIALKSVHLQEEFEEALLEILDPVQVGNLAGFCLRKEGMLAVKYKVVAEELNLSRIQGEKISRIFKVRTLAVPSAKSAKEAMEQVDAQAKKKKEDITLVLTPEQIKKISDLSGPRREK